MTTCKPLCQAVTALAAVTVLTLTACAPDEDSAEFEDPEQVTQTQEDDEETVTDEPEDADDAEDEAAAAGNADEDSAAEDESNEQTEGASSSTGPLNPEDAIETITHEVPGDSSTSVEVGFHGLRVEGEVMLLELSFTGEFYGSQPMNVYSMLGGTAIYPELNDRQNLKQYTVIGSGHNRWSTPATNSASHYESGQTAPYWAYYAAPVDDIETITVSVIPGSVEFEDVEIEWGESDPGGTADDDAEDGE